MSIRVFAVFSFVPASRGQPSLTRHPMWYTPGVLSHLSLRLMFIETSKDLLFVVLAFCVLWLTVFISWLLYYVIAIVRDAESLVRQVRGAVTKIDQLAGVVHEKMERSAASLTLIAQAVKELIVWGIQERGKMKDRAPSGRRK